MINSIYILLINTVIYGPSRTDLNHKLGGILPHTFSNAPFYRSSVFHLDEKNVTNYLHEVDTRNAFLPGPSQKDLNHNFVNNLNLNLSTEPFYRSSVFHLDEKNRITQIRNN